MNLIDLLQAEIRRQDALRAGATPDYLDAIRRRYELARLAGIDAHDAGNGWDAAKIGAVLDSLLDVPVLHDEVKRLRAALAEHTRG